jgi:hypothetical protein
MKCARLLGAALAFAVSSSLASAVSASPAGDFFAAHSVFDGVPAEPHAVGRPWHVTFEAPSAPAVVRVDAAIAAASVAQDTQRPMAVEYSDAYNRRRKIHMIASYATIPLFAAQYWAGEQLFDDSNDSSAKSLHGALTIGIAALFTVNTVTGVWNLLEARKDPNGRTRRLVHGLMMFGADLGFVATGALAPDDEDTSGRSTHRTVAITSMAVATASYVYMLVTR